MATLNLAHNDRGHQTLTVRGKRNKTRVIPIDDTGILAALADWFAVTQRQGVAPEHQAYSPVGLWLQK
jgi:hypothetical protein